MSSFDLVNSMIQSFDMDDLLIAATLMGTILAQENIHWLGMGILTRAKQSDGATVV